MASRGCIQPQWQNWRVPKARATCIPPAPQALAYFAGEARKISSVYERRLLCFGGSLLLEVVVGVVLLFGGLKNAGFEN